MLVLRAGERVTHETAGRPGLGFSDVDQNPMRAAMIAGMDATGRWPAVQTLRSWERSRLRLRPGEHLLDVGCGTGDVLVGLAADVPLGRGVGVDASAEMLDEASRRARRAGVAVELVKGDAARIEFPDGAFDACRSERTLQWLRDPDAALRELVRLARPGGRVVVTDTDWRTFLVDHPDPDLAAKILAGLATTRGAGHSVGGRLLNLLRDAGAQQVEVAAATHTWTAWDPDRTAQPSGFVPLRAAAGGLVEAGHIGVEDLDRFIALQEDAARHDRLFMSLTMFSAAGVAP